MSTELVSQLGLGVSFLGLVAIIFSILQVKRSIDMATTGRLYGELHQIHSAFIKHPEYRRYFFHGEWPEEDMEKDHLYRARSIAEMFLDIFEQMFILRKATKKELRPLLVAYIRHMCDGSPYLVSYLKENEALLYPAEFRELVVEKWKEQAQLRPKTTTAGPGNRADA